MLRSLGASIAVVCSFSLSHFAVGAVTNYVICSDSTAGLSPAQQLATALNSKFGGDTLQFTAISAGSMREATTMLNSGACNVIELDAAKSYGAASTVEAVPLALEGSGSYLTMAVARKAKMDADHVSTLCDIAKQRNWRACHTGYMKSAGWISPMSALLQCAETDQQLQSACKDLTATGETCHETAFGDSCVPSMIGANGSPLMNAGGEICAACRVNGTASGSCAATDYGDYFGSALGLLQGACDIAFVRTSTLECPEESQGYCKSGADAACVASGTCDSTSVYAKGYSVPASTLVKVPGYGNRVPAHVLMMKGMSTEHADLLMTELPAVWQSTRNRSLLNVFGQSIADVLGSSFIKGLQNLPFFYEYYGLERPAANVETSDSKAWVTPVVAAVVPAVAVVTLAVLAYWKRDSIGRCFSKWRNTAPLATELSSR